jgi:putative sigma-54 modulation protein
MRLDITGRNIDITPALRQLIERRLARIERLLNDSAVSANVILALEKYRHRTEIIVRARGDHTMRGLGEGNGWTLSIRQATDKVEQQAKRLKSKWAERKRSASRRRVPSVRRAGTVPAPPVAEGLDGRPRVIRATRYAVKPMSIEDAAMRVEDTAETFVVFRNAESDAISIVYRRKDGNLGLIEPD